MQDWATIPSLIYGRRISYHPNRPNKYLARVGDRLMHSVPGTRRNNGDIPNRLHLSQKVR